jgi:hypothetical protein
MLAIWSGALIASLVLAGDAVHLLDAALFVDHAGSGLATAVRVDAAIARVILGPFSEM